MLWSLGGAAIAALTVTLSTTAVVFLQKEESEQSRLELERYKAEAGEKISAAEAVGKSAQADIAKADAQIALANEGAAKANERAANLEKDAASARLETEKLKAVVAWRVLSPATALALEKALTANPGVVNLRYIDGDPEALYLAIQISQIFANAKWQVAPGAVKPPGRLMFGISIANVPSAQGLRDAFSAARISFSDDALPTDGLSFNVTTIRDAPVLMVGSKTPPQLP